MEINVFHSLCSLQVKAFQELPGAGKIICFNYIALVLTAFLLLALLDQVDLV
jgi:hypothetical protein